MMKLHEKKQRDAKGVRYVDDVDYADPVSRDDVPASIKLAIEGDPIEKTNKGAVLATVPGANCGCFGGIISENSLASCPWLYIFIPPTIPNPAALNYSSRRGHPPAKEIPNVTQARKRELRDLCSKFGWELDTEDVWGDEDVSPSPGDDDDDIAYYASMAKMKKDGWFSWTIAPKGNYTKPERWEAAVGRKNADDEERYRHYAQDYVDMDDIFATYGSTKTGDDEFTGFGHITESTKVTLTVGQIKRLVAESRNRQLVNEDNEEETEPPAVKQLYGLYNDGGNCWSRYGNSERWYWTTSWADEGETAAEFRKRLRRMGEGKAQRNYHEYVRGSYGVKVFSKWEDFEKAARRVGLNPEKPSGI